MRAILLGHSIATWTVLGEEVSLFLLTGFRSGDRSKVVVYPVPRANPVRCVRGGDMQHKAALAGLAAAAVFAAMAAALSSESPPTATDGTALLLAMDNPRTGYAWQLPYAQMHERSRVALAGMRGPEALAAARMEFILCPPYHDGAYEPAIESVKRALVALDGDDRRARVFVEYAHNGPAGKEGTADDLKDVLAGVSLEGLTAPEASYDEEDSALASREPLAADDERAWYEVSRAFLRLEGARFDEGLEMLLAAARSQERFAMPQPEDARYHIRKKISDRLDAGFSVVYRARRGTLAGMEEYVARCREYARYGGAGLDGRDGTEDDVPDPRK